MTDRHTGYVVTLSSDIREDDAQAIVDAIRMVKGVLSVEPVTADPFQESMWRSRMHRDLYDKVLGAIQEVTFPK